MRSAKFLRVCAVCSSLVLLFVVQPADAAVEVRSDTPAISTVVSPDLPASGDVESTSQLSDGYRGGVVLVLSGGGTKGIAHLGVLKVLEEEGIPIVGIVGTSMGSVIGGLYATGYTVDQLKELVFDTNIMGLVADSGTRIRPDAGDHRPVGESSTFYTKRMTKDLKSVGPKGILPAVALANFLSQYTANIQTTDFDYLPIPFACVATDLSTGEEVVLRDGSLASAIRASVSIPGLFEPWQLEGRLLVDGGLVANLPVGIAKEIFPGYPVIAVNLAGRSITKPPESFKSAIDVLSQTIDIMTIDRLRRDEALADLLLYPDVSGLGMLDGGGYEKIYERGLAVAEEMRQQMVAVSAAAPVPPMARSFDDRQRIVRSIRVEGLPRRTALDIEKSYSDWVGKPYDAKLVGLTTERLSKREEIAAFDIDTYPASDGDPDDVDVVLSFERRPPYEIGVGGYTSNLHSHRWLALMINARDISVEGDSMYLEGRAGGDYEWGAQMRYFSPLLADRQWGIALNARRDSNRAYGMDYYHLERYSLRALYYVEKADNRFGIGLAGEHSNVKGDFDNYTWGPYFYYNLDTLDNALIPTKGLSLNSQVWWNSANVWVSRTNLTGYIPWSMPNLHFVLNLGLETGDKEHQAYRVLLGDQEELYSLSAHPYIGDQAAWAKIGVGRNFYTSWWGALRGEVFAAYGMVMDDWNRKDDAWEIGAALSVPGQFFNGKVLLIYDDGGEFTLGFTLGVPRWWASPLP